MTERSERWWIPVLAAVVGLAGGVGGAYVGGEVANNGQEQQFDNQRAAQLQDLLIDTYGRFVRSAASTYAVVLAWDKGDSTKAQLIAAQGEAEGARAEVTFLAASDDVDQAAARLEEAVTHVPHVTPEMYAAERDRFLEVAAQSLGPAE
jgi:hypothetical protein